MDLLLFTISLLLHPSLFLSISPTTDTTALLLFRSLTDTHGNLLPNWTLPSSSSSHAAKQDACSAAWRGVRCSSTGHVVSLSLPSLSLRGPVSSLSSLPYLHLLDLSNNRLNGTLDSLTTSSRLKLLYLSGNDFSGEIPQNISSLSRLIRLDLSNNNLKGPIPSSVSNLTHLLTLRLQNNELSGQIPSFFKNFTTLTELNLSNNGLYGKIPESLVKRFGENSFQGNEGLCGVGIFRECSSLRNVPPDGGASATVPAKPSSLPLTVGDRDREVKRGLRPGAIAAIVVVSSVVLVVLLLYIAAHCFGRYPEYSGSRSGSEVGKRRSSSSYGTEKRVHASNGGDSDGTSMTDRSKLIFYDRKRHFELEDLLKASAEMLGKGTLGTVYKAVLDGGYTVAVKRLKDSNPCGRNEFEQYMDVIGKVYHSNIVKLRAYYFAKEEKLLVYDYLPNGSLHSLLHGNRGPGTIPLDWTTRICLVLGAARGLAKIHEDYSVMKIPHGNVKSSNILLDKYGNACVADFGLALLLSPGHATARLGGYRAPEQVEAKKLSQKADVYSFGVLLLEVLTGKAPYDHPSPSRGKMTGEDNEVAAVDLPRWVRSVVRDKWTSEVFDQDLLRYKNIEEELVCMLQVGLACVVPQPEKRPSMSQVAKMIEEIRVEQSPLGDDYDESRPSLSPSLAMTE